MHTRLKHPSQASLRISVLRPSTRQASRGQHPIVLALNASDPCPIIAKLLLYYWGNPAAIITTFTIAFSIVHAPVIISCICIHICIYMNIFINTYVYRCIHFLYIYILCICMIIYIYTYTYKHM